MKVERLEKSRHRCEIHLLVDSHRRMLPTDLGYCGRKAQWWVASYALCDGHKDALVAFLRSQEE